MHKTEKPVMTTVERKARVEALNILVRRAALSIHHSGQISLLAQKAGLSYNSIITSINRGYFSAGGASALEIAAGREHLKKEELAPHVYAVEV